MATTLTTRAPAAPAAPAAAPAGPSNPVSARRSPVAVAALLGAAAGGMLLAGLLAAHLAMRVAADQWVPEDTTLDLYLGVVLLPTAGMALVSAGWALYAVRHDDNTSSLFALGLTAVLGLAVVNGAWTALRQAGFGPADHTFGALYFAVVGTYLALAVAGTLATLVALLRAAAGQLRPRDHGAVTVALAWTALLAVGWAGVYVVVWVLK